MCRVNDSVPRPASRCKGGYGGGLAGRVRAAVAA